MITKNFKPVSFLKEEISKFSGRKRDIIDYWLFKF